MTAGHGWGERAGQLSRIPTVIASQPWFASGTPAQRRALAQAIQNAAQQARHRQERVRAHPDLVERLCRAFRYTRPDQWTGYVPPALDCDGRRNTSPARAELLAILRAVADRERETAAD